MWSVIPLFASHLTPVSVNGDPPWTFCSSNSWGNNWMSFLDLALLLDKMKEGINSNLPIVSHWPILQQGSSKGLAMVHGSGGGRHLAWFNLAFYIVFRPWFRQGFGLGFRLRFGLGIGQEHGKGFQLGFRLMWRITFGLIQPWVLSQCLQAAVKISQDSRIITELLFILWTVLLKFQSNHSLQFFTSIELSFRKPYMCHRAVNGIT